MGVGRRSGGQIRQAFGQWEVAIRFRGWEYHFFGTIIVEDGQEGTRLEAGRQVGVAAFCF